jgi:hypothetical protein
MTQEASHKPMKVQHPHPSENDSESVFTKIKTVCD